MCMFIATYKHFENQSGFIYDSLFFFWRMYVFKRKETDQKNYGHFDRLKLVYHYINAPYNSEAL